MGAMCFMPRLTDGMESSWSHKMPRASFCCTRCERSWTPAVSRVRRNAWRIRPRVRRSPPRHLAVAGRRARGISVGSRVLSPARGVARHTRPAPAAASPRIRPARPATTRPRGDPAGRHARQAGARPGRRDRARCPSRHSPPDPAAVVSMMRWPGRPPGVAETRAAEGSLARRTPHAGSRRPFSPRSPGPADGRSGPPGRCLPRSGWPCDRRTACARRASDDVRETPSGPAARTSVRTGPAPTR